MSSTPASARTLQALPDPLAGKGLHWHAGPEHMARVSEAAAHRLLGCTLPPMGYERLTAQTSQDACFGGRAYLLVQNISGHYYLTCYQAPRSQWPALFDVTVLPVLESKTALA